MEVTLVDLQETRKDYFTQWVASMTRQHSIYAFNLPSRSYNAILCNQLGNSDFGSRLTVQSGFNFFEENRKVKLRVLMHRKEKVSSYCVS